jgi:hypothetical protein
VSDQIGYSLANVSCASALRNSTATPTQRASWLPAQMPSAVSPRQTPRISIAQPQAFRLLTRTSAWSGSTRELPMAAIP